MISSAVRVASTVGAPAAIPLGVLCWVSVDSSSSGSVRSYMFPKHTIRRP
jgi:hypothetical protein